MQASQEQQPSYQRRNLDAEVRLLPPQPVLRTPLRQSYAGGAGAHLQNGIAGGCMERHSLAERLSQSN